MMTVLLSGCLGRSGLDNTELTFSLPTTLSITRGASLLNTGISYESASDDAVWLNIGGRRALKRMGDSVSWKGSLFAGTNAELALRLVHIGEDKVDLAGTARITVHDVSPEAGGLVTTAPVTFSGPVAYGVAVDSYIPGTTLAYLGPAEEGAELSGLGNEYPYRRMGDSVIWEGRLRPGVYLRTELRTVQYDSKGLRLAGIATLWFGE
ncbi:MAG: hypothetical protein GXY79_06300 [Chloroflexi bacterium]|nr:hypothetical protein [Chloroflexota bacterium]